MTIISYIVYFFSMKMKPTSCYYYMLKLCQVFSATQNHRFEKLRRCSMLLTFSRKTAYVMSR